VRKAPLTKVLPLGLVAAGLVPGLTQVAWAVQTHGGDEGLVAHQLGHVLFACGLIVVYRVCRRGQWSGPGWPSFRWFLVLSLAWCALTFAGHFLHEWVDPARFVRDGSQVRYFRAATAMDWTYYLSRLDHLLWIPALVALLRALVLWERSAEDAT
jgi:hypothetical protein